MEFDALMAQLTKDFDSDRRFWHIGHDQRLKKPYFCRVGGWNPKTSNVHDPNADVWMEVGFGTSLEEAIMEALGKAEGYRRSQ
jgi:hypothetical protein